MAIVVGLVCVVARDNCTFSVFLSYVLNQTFLHKKYSTRSAQHFFFALLQCNNDGTTNYVLL